MDRSAITAAVVKTVARANKIYPKINLPIPTISFYSKGGAAGKAHLNRCHLEFNEVLAKENPNSFMSTVIHEVAHLVTTRAFPYAKQAHGPEFKAVDVALGGRGTRCHSYDVSSVKTKRTKTRYEVVCSCQTHWTTKKIVEALKNPRNAVTCKICNSKVEYTGRSKAFI